MSIQVFTDMIGKVFEEVTGAPEAEEVCFRGKDGPSFRFYHSQDCCERVRVADIIGDLSDLVGSPIVEAEEISNTDAPVPDDAESYTWTFYRFSTARGTVTVRWLGESNGYYSEGVDFEALA